MPRLAGVLAALALALAPAACGSGDEEDGGAPPGDGAGRAQAERPRTEGGCERVERPAPRRPVELEAPRRRLDPRRDWRMTLRTSCGTIVIALDARRAPRTASSLASLARSGFYDGLAFHRVVEGFVIQGGDPQGDGSGGPGYQTVEAPPPGARYTRGVVAMAKTATDPRGAAGSQFFIITAADARASAGLTPDYAIAGRVVRGLDVVRRIERIPTDPPGDGVPQDPVVIEDASVSAR